MKVGTKIALGFTSLVGIAVLLGGMAVWQMVDVSGESNKLAQEYVPEVKVAVDLRSAANRTMYEMRGYGLSEEAAYYAKAQEEMAAVQQHLEEAADLADRAVHLQALRGQVTKAKSAADTYAQLMEQTEQAIANLNAHRTKLDENAATYMQNCATFIENQNKSFKTDLEERTKKVAIVTNVVNLGTTVRVTNFRAQASQDMGLMQQAVAALNGLNAHLAELRPITHDEADIKRIDDTEAAAQKYAQNMEAYIQTQEAMAAAGKQMDENAAAYMKNCSDFLAHQSEAMHAEFKKDGANLEERLQKITLVNDIIDAGNAARVGNFKAQATQDPELMRQTIETFGGVKQITASLRKITHEDADIKRIDETEAAADAYLVAMDDYLKNYLQLGTHRSEMDEAAGQYVAQCADFLAGQQDKLKTDMHERHEKITLVNDIIDLGSDSRIKAFKSQATRDPAVMEAAIANFAKLDEKYAALRRITRLEEDLQRIDNTKAAGQAYASALTSFLAQWKELQDLGTQRTQAGAAVITACNTTADAGIEQTNEIANQAASTLSSATTVMLGGLSIAVLVGVLLAFFITRGITKPLTRIIAGLNEGADQVNDAATQVSSASQQLAEGASEQASSLEETSASLEEMAAMTRTNAENSKEANTLSAQARSAAENGDQTMHRLNEAMAAINESSGQISKIIKVIEEIAFQTNLLALNAAVEAARAGEHGKGFAVVADEVRNLAQRCAEAARETTGLIEDSVNKAKDGADVAAQVGQSLGAIVGDVAKVTELINGISQASQEQAQGVDQVNTAISQMDRVTQQNASGAEESASAAEELSAQAATVKSMVDELSAMVGGRSGDGPAASRGTSPRKAGKRHKINVAHIKAGPHSAPTRVGSPSGKPPDNPTDDFMPMDANEGLSGF